MISCFRCICLSFVGFTPACPQGLSALSYGRSFSAASSEASPNFHKRSAEGSVPSCVQGGERMFEYPHHVDWVECGVPARWATRLVVFPRFVTPYRLEEHHEPEPLPPFELGPPLPAGTLPPLLHLFGKGERGKGSRLERGSRLVIFSNCGRFGRGSTTSRVL